MSGYICFYNRKKFEVYADSPLKARELATKWFRISPKKQHQIAVVLVEKDGEPVVHSIQSF